MTGKLTMVPVVSVPQWSKDIRRLRSDLRLSQTAFGKILNCSAMGVSRWERGEQAPSAAFYLRMARLARRSFGWLFWNLAGLTEDDLHQMPNPKTRRNKRPHHLSKEIAVLEAEVARSTSREDRRAALVPHLPTQELRREYQIIAKEEAQFALVVVRHIQMLKQFG